MPRSNYAEKLSDHIESTFIEKINLMLLEAQSSHIDIITKHDGKDYFTINDFLAQASIMESVYGFDSEMTFLSEEKLTDEILDVAKYDKRIKCSVDVYKLILDSKHDPGKVLHIDPIDGNRVFKNKGRFWSSAVAYQEDGKVKLAMVNEPRAGRIFKSLEGQPSSVSYGKNHTEILKHPGLYIGEWQLYLVAPKVSIDYGDDEFLPGLNPAELNKRLKQEFVGADTKRPEKIDFVKPGSGSSSLAYCLMANERYDVGIALFQEPFDVVPGGFILENAGGKVLLSTCDAKTGKIINPELKPYKERQHEFSEPGKKYHVFAAHSHTTMDVLMNIALAKYEINKPKV